MKITKRQLRKLIQERVQDSTTLEIELANTGTQPVEIPWYIIMDALEGDLSADGLLVEIEEFIENEYGFDEYFKLTDKADAEVRKMHDDYQAGGVLSDEESYERGFYEGKITKSKLRKIIKEEKKVLLKESRVRKEATMLGTLDSIASSIEELANGMYGLVDPNGNGDAGDEMAQDLEMQVERLTDLYQAMVSHFESMDSENQAEDEMVDAGIRAREMSKGRG
jgi:hypothetical protein